MGNPGDSSNLNAAAITSFADCTITLIHVKADGALTIHNEFNEEKDTDMQIDNHSLINEFPAYREKIHALKISDRHFHKLFDEYHDVDKALYRLETEDSPIGDEQLGDLKKQRLLLKDQLYAILQRE